MSKAGEFDKGCIPFQAAPEDAKASGHHIPQGTIDFGKNIPAQDIALVALTVELLARPDLHPALCDLLIETAQEVRGKAGLFKRKGEFPAPLEHDYPISEGASR